VYTPNPKLDTFDELLTSILAEDKNKAIVWCNFTKELDIVEDYLRRKKISYIRVDGSNSNIAQKASREFDTDPTKRVWLGQIATGVAITLLSAAYTIYFGLNYKLDDFTQSMDRNYRIGQNAAAVFVYILTSKNSVLDYVRKALEQKKDIAKSLTEGAVRCAFCERFMVCLGENVKPFDHRCIYSDTVQKYTTRLRTL
jgi:DNA helicase INO80